MVAEHGISATRAAEGVFDAIRYTACFPPQKLASGTKAILSRLQAQGNGIVQLKNTWLDPKSSYRGINVQMRSPDGQLFEVQFHTPRRASGQRTKELITYSSKCENFLKIPRSTTNLKNSKMQFLDRCAGLTISIVLNQSRRNRCGNTKMLTYYKQTYPNGVQLFFGKMKMADLKYTTGGKVGRKAMATVRSGSSTIPASQTGSRR
jgi:hypothetical protein